MASSINEGNLLTPYLRRLSRQLHVDFATDVHCAEGKRKREPTRSVYEEAAMKTFKHKKKKERAEKQRMSDDDDSNHIVKMMNAAASLTQLRIRRDMAPSVSESSLVAEKAIESINKAHEDTVAAKDFIIKSITTALATKEELIRTQSMLISMMQQCADQRACDH